MTRLPLDIEVRSPWDWSHWNTGDPEGGGVRVVSMGPLSIVYVINQLTRHLAVLDIVWLG
ncbi:hypothetical protein ACFW9I_15840 [[Kitasatospora] papulosa]|uniref:hypothetical protein n=1 Tax=[Kitasatospora] papulosa TaxID=1464011 RepID=UPI00369DC45E